ADDSGNRTVTHDHAAAIANGLIAGTDRRPAICMLRTPLYSTHTPAGTSATAFANGGSHTKHTNAANPKDQANRRANAPWRAAVYAKTAPLNTNPSSHPIRTGTFNSSRVCSSNAIAQKPIQQ